MSTIWKQHWGGKFADALGGKWKQIEVFLGELEKLRDPHAHQRELMPHQKHLVVGLSGEIRNRLVRYRSKMETSEDYYPRLESVRDNLGNAWVVSTGRPVLQTQNRLRVGDTLEFSVSATDPMGETLSYRTMKALVEAESGWHENNLIRLTIDPRDVRRQLSIIIYVRSSRPYHAQGEYDDAVTFLYEVLPPQ